MARGEEERRFWMAFEIEESDLRAGWAAALKRGEHVTKYAERAFQNQIIIDSQEDGADRIVVARALALKELDRRLVITQLKIGARGYLDNPTEEGRELLRIACEVAEVAIEDLMDDVENTPHVSELIKEIGMLSTAENWLAERLSPGVEYLNHDIIKEAEVIGIGESSIKRAKTKLGIKHRKVGTKFMWYIEKRPEGDGSNENGEHDQFT